MSKEFFQGVINAISDMRSALPSALNAPSAPNEPMPQPPESAAQQAASQINSTQEAASAAEDAETQNVEEVCQSCEDKWLVVTIERNTKHNFDGRWDCTVGDLKMEIWNSENSGTGPVVFRCKTSERGGPANANFRYSSNSAQGANYEYFNQYMIMPSEDYGLSAHSTNNYKTYGYNTNYLTKPRPGIAIYGSGSGAMDRRTGVLIHPGTHHRWSVGCVVLHASGEVRDGRYRFDKTSSVNTLLTFLEKIHDFTGESRHSIGVKIERVKLIINENFNED